MITKSELRERVSRITSGEATADVGSRDDLIMGLIEERESEAYAHAYRLVTGNGWCHDYTGSDMSREISEAFPQFPRTEAPDA